MHRLAQPQVLKSAALAALGTALLSYPRFALWENRPYGMWYYEALTFLGAMVLWGFVFAWHSHYTNRPVLTLKIGLRPFITATLLGIFAAVVVHMFLDPYRRGAAEEYPANAGEWLAQTLFTLTFLELFLIFAPFAWLMRLFQNKKIALILTIAFGLLVLLLKLSSSDISSSPWLITALLVRRIVYGALAIYFYLRGGLLLVWWWSLLIEARHLLTLGAP